MICCKKYTRVSTVSVCFQFLGWTRENLKDWGQFARVICPTVAMNFILWLVFELGTFLAGEYCIFNISIVRLEHSVVSRCWILSRTSAYMRC